ncbi:MAG: glycoside hydrolase, partial [Asticcacaulis sp.]
TYALGDGLQSELCLHAGNGLQARLRHDFSDGAGTLDLLFSLQPPDPLAPAVYYRRLLTARGQFVSLARKAVPDLHRLYGAPQAYVWGDGRDLAFLDDLKAAGITRITLSYDQDPNDPKQHLVGPDYLKTAYARGYLAGPYDAFDNAQPPATADSPSAIWSPDLYPSGCIQKAGGQIVAGFAHRGCELSSAAVAAHPQAISPASRYDAHVADGASEVFVDVDAFGEFYHDYNPARPMTMAQDRANRLVRLGMGIKTYHLVLGSENVTAWSSGVAHFSHGTADAHMQALWPIQADRKRFGGYWPPDPPPLFFMPFMPTAAEMRLLFGPADRLPLFEAAFHDSVIASDRWELGLMKVTGAERQRFARALLYGTPTMWNLNRKELVRVGTWLRAAQDDFRIVHGWSRPVALTGFRWLSEDHLIQQTAYADGRVLTANFSDAPWRGIGVNCVHIHWPGGRQSDLCPPPDPAPYK